MPLISKPNYNQVFASQAPEQDKPAVFNNYPLGWGVESRPNNGKPTIKGFNFLQQTSDLKALWILQNGACLPYDESIEYAEGAPVLKDGVIQYKTASGFKSRDAVTVPTYNNAADGVDPVTGVADGAYFNVRSSNDDSYIDEYQNVGGVPAPTGKSYPSSLIVTELDKSAIRTVSTTGELVPGLAKEDGQEIYVQSRTAGRHKGGGRFYFDSSRVAENDGVTVFNGWVRSKIDKLKPEWAGAIGDGVTDDGPAFRLLNSVGFYAALRKPSNNLFRENGYTISLDRNAKYRLVGSDFMGSPLGLDTTETLKRIQFILEGNGATIFFDPQNEFDQMFNIDAFIDQPIINNVIIYPRRTKSSLPVGAGVIFNIISGYNGLSGAGNLEVSNLHVRTVRYGTDQLIARVRRVFQIKGTTQADQIRVKNSKFSYFKEAYYSENAESVNNTFEDCGFFAGGAYGGTFTDVRYFHVTEMYDGLKIVNSNMTLYGGETVFYGRSPLNAAGTYLKGVAQHRVYFQDNRFEFQGTSDITMWDSNFLTGCFSGSNFRLASGGATATTKFKAFESSALDFERINFGKTKIYAPITTAISYSGNGLAYGVNARNIEFLKSDMTLGVSNGVDEHSIVNALANKRSFKMLNFENQSFVNGNELRDWQIIPDNGTYTSSRKTNKITFSKNGIAFANAFEIPPYQVVKKVSISFRSGMSSVTTALRLWFGSKSNNNFIDIPNINNTVIKSELTLFEGRAVIFDGTIGNNIITIDPLNSSGEVITASVLSELSVEYHALSATMQNITTESPTTIVLNSNRVSGYGTTTDRPTQGLYIGMPYFDTTLNKPIYCKQVSPPVWVDAAGTVV